MQKRLSDSASKSPGAWADHARAVDQPEPGYFLTRLCRGGWQVPSRIIHWDDGTWQAEIDGELWGVPHEDPLQADGVSRIWSYGQISTEAEYRYRTELREWARSNQPDHPCLHPNRPVDLTEAAPIF